MNIVEGLKLVGKNLDKVAIGVLLLFCLFFYFKARNIEDREIEARINAQNQIAELSSIVRESETTWSRLAQQSESSNEILMALEERNEALTELIESRNEEISSLTTALATVRPIRVVVAAGEGANQSVEPSTNPTDPERLRVDFDTVWREYLRIHGFTLTNPASADISVDFTRPINFTVVTTQAEDLSWRTYIESDWPDLQIGEIESRVNPVARPNETRRWEQDVSISLLGGASVTGTSGIFGAELAYDFGALDIGIFAGGITYLGSTDFLVGGRVGIAPFDL
jgi:hypothetical protein